MVPHTSSARGMLLLFLLAALLLAPRPAHGASGAGVQPQPATACAFPDGSARDARA